jgi:hypothetical protein
VAISLAFSPDGKSLVAGDWEGFLCFCDAVTGKETRRLRAGELVIHGVAFSPDGKTVVSGGADQNVSVWDLSTGKIAKKFYGHWGDVQAVAYTPDGRFVLSVSDDDLQRTRYYEDNQARAQLHAGFKDYGEFLDSLRMDRETLIQAIGIHAFTCPLILAVALLTRGQLPADAAATGKTSLILAD